MVYNRIAAGFYAINSRSLLRSWCGSRRVINIYGIV